MPLPTTPGPGPSCAPSSPGPRASSPTPTPELDALAALADRPDAGGPVPSDVPLVRLDQDQLDRLGRAYPGLAEVLPLTSLQEGFLFHTLIDAGGGTDTYVTQLHADLDGPLDPAALRAAAQQLLDRHPALRAGFAHDGLTEPVQAVPERLDLPWAEADLSALAADPEAQQAESERLAERERVLPFDLTRPPLLRMLLLRLGGQRHRLVLSNHHILWDGWSTPVLLRELFVLLAGGRPEPAAALGDYLAWLGAQDLDGARAAWSAAMGGLHEPTHLVPEAAHRDPVPQRQLRVELDEETTGRLGTRLRGLGVTVNTLVEAAWAIHLSRATGSDDVVFGTSVSGRDADLPGIEDLVGMLTNTLPVRVSLDPGESLAELLVRLQDEQSALADHHHLGLSEIQRLAGVGPLFDTTTVTLNYPLDLAAFEPLPGGLRLTALDARDGTHYPLRMAVIPGPRLRLWLGYRPDCYTEAEAEKILDRFRGLLETAADGPEARVGDLDLPSEEEQLRLLASWGGYGG
jgi:hypothetical protein